MTITEHAGGAPHDLLVPAALRSLAREVLAEATRAGIMLATAESCTGGLVAALLTDAPGSSQAFWGGVVSYDNGAKSALLGVDPALIAAQGAVSPEVALAMARGAAAFPEVGLAASLTGVAGPAGGSPAKPVGLVYIAVADARGAATVEERRFGDLGRDGVRLAAAEAALGALRERLKASSDAPPPPQTRP